MYIGLAMLSFRRAADTYETCSSPRFCMLLARGKFEYLMVVSFFVGLSVALCRSRKHTAKLACAFIRIRYVFNNHVYEKCYEKLRNDC